MEFKLKGKIFEFDKVGMEGLCNSTISNLIYYDRKQDEEVPAGLIEQAVKAGLFTKQDIVSFLSKALDEMLEV